MSVLSEDIEDALPELQKMAESRMLDEFDIKVPGDGWVLVDGKEVQEMELLFSTPGRVRVRGSQPVRESEVGDRTSVSVTRELHIPIGSPSVPVGAVAFPTYVHPTSDQMLEGAALRLAGPSPGSQMTARRLEIVEVLT